MKGAPLNILYPLSSSIIKTTLWDKDYCYPIFTDEKTKLQLKRIIEFTPIAASSGVYNPEAGTPFLMKFCWYSLYLT